MSIIREFSVINNKGEFSIVHKNIGEMFLKYPYKTGVKRKIV